mgnify:FL=1
MEKILKSFGFKDPELFELRKELDFQEGYIRSLSTISNQINRVEPIVSIGERYQRKFKDDEDIPLPRKIIKAQAPISLKFYSDSISLLGE